MRTQNEKVPELEQEDRHLLAVEASVSWKLYCVEKRLASQIIASPSVERPSVIRHAYEYYYGTVFPYFRGKSYAEYLKQSHSASDVENRLLLLGRWLGPGCSLLEIGPGGCEILREVGRRGGQAVGLDVAIYDEATSGGGFRHILFDGVRVPASAGVFDIVYSNQVLEHVHPEDAMGQIVSGFAVLKPGGRYVVTTPNRLSGPHDVSREFSDVASGFHLREYTTSELITMLRGAGFKTVDVMVGFRGSWFVMPRPIILIVERALGLAPVRLRRSIGGWPIVRRLLMPTVVGRRSG